MEAMDIAAALVGFVCQSARWREIDEGGHFLEYAEISHADTWRRIAYGPYKVAYRVPTEYHRPATMKLRMD